MAKKKSKRERSGGNSGGMPAVQQGHELNAAAARDAQGSPAASGAHQVAVAADPKAAGAVATGKGEPTRSLTEKRQEIYADVRAQREARRGRSRNDNAGQEAPAGYVRRSSLYLAVGLALAAGLFVGSLLPGLAGHSMSGAPSTTGAPAAEQGSQAQPADKEDAATRLASHILELEDAVRKNPNDVAAWVQLGNLYFDSGKAPQSINAYERALLLKPDDANVLTDLGVMYREAGKYEQAVQSFRNASKVDPKHQNALFNRGVVLFFDLKRKEEGRKVWQELLILNPQAKAPDGRSLKDMLRDLK